MRTLLALAAAGLAAPAMALQVFACEPEWGALVKELGGKDVEIYTATTALQDVHRIQARPSLIAKYRQADLLVCTGAELEVGWLPALADKGNNPKVRPGSPGYFEAFRHVTMQDLPASLDRSEGDVHPFGNPHIQTSPVNIVAVARPLAQRLAELDPAHAAQYKERLADFESRWQDALQRWTVRAKPLKGLHVVSAHQGWIYLYQWLGLTEVATLEPKPGVPPSAGYLERILGQIKTAPVKFVVYAAYQDARPAQWLSKRAGIPTVELPFSVGGADGTADLFGLFEVTLDRLLAATGSKP